MRACCAGFGGRVSGSTLAGSADRYSDPVWVSGFFPGEKARFNCHAGRGFYASLSNSFTSFTNSRVLKGLVM